MNQVYILDLNKHFTGFYNKFLAEKFDYQEVDESGKCIALYNIEYNVLIGINPSAPYDTLQSFT